MNPLLKLLAFLTFILVITPLGLVLRLAGADYLGMRRGKDKASYWHAKTRWDEKRSNPAR